MPEPSSRIRHHGNRWGRSEEAREAVMEAVDNLLLERGFAALTIEAVAARAGVGKQTIYRWWDSKTDLLLDAFIGEMQEELPPIETGSLDTVCRALLSQFVAFFNDASNAAMFRALAGQAQLEAPAARRFRGEVLGAILARFDRAFDAGRQSDAWPKTADRAASIEALLAPLFYRLLVSGQPLGDLAVDRIVDQVLAGGFAGVDQGQGVSRGAPPA